MNTSDNVRWFPLWLLPGLLGALAGLSWLYWRGVRRGRLALSLVGLVLLWGAGMLLAVSPWWSLGLLLLSLAFAAALMLLAYLIWREANHRAEVARLSRIAEVRADRVSALSHEIRTPLAMIVTVQAVGDSGNNDGG